MDFSAICFGLILSLISVMSMSLVLMGHLTLQEPISFIMKCVVVHITTRELRHWLIDFDLPT
jgi:hypothetical protein